MTKYEITIPKQTFIIEADNEDEARDELAEIEAHSEPPELKIKVLEE